MLVEDGVLWLPTKEIITENFEDALYGMDGDFVSGLEQAYGNFCKNVKSCVEHHHRCGENVDHYHLFESKSMAKLSKVSDSPTLFKRMNSFSTRYRRFVRQSYNLSSKKFRLTTAKFGKRIKDLYKKYKEDKISLNDFRRQSVRVFEEAYKSAWNFGKESSGVYKLLKRVRKVSREEESWFRSAVRSELEYWNNFLDELGKNKEWKGKRYRPEERIEMYIKTIQFMYQSSRVANLPNNVLLFWYPKRKRSGGPMCPGCQYMVNNSPFPADIMPTVPRAGDTPCLYRCVHRVVVRVSTVKAVKRRRAQLPSKQEMLKDLHGFMGKRNKYRRKKTVDYDPWRGKAWGQIK